MTKLIAYAGSWIGHGSLSDGRHEVYRLYDDGTFDSYEGSVPEDLPCLAYYESSVTGTGSGVSFGEFLGGSLSRGNCEKPEMVALAQKFWDARKLYLAGSRAHTEQLAREFAPLVRAFLARPSRRINPEAQIYRAAGWFGNVRSAGLRGRIAELAGELKKASGGYHEKVEASGLAESEHEEFIQQLWAAQADKISVAV